MAPLKVLISGAGIGGPAIAFWLARIGCDITVVERNPKLRTNGQQLDFRGQGIVIMKMMGLEDAVRNVQCPETGMRILDHRGNSKAFIAANTSGSGSQTATTEYEIMRGDLVRILYDSTKDLDGVKYVFGCHITDFTQDEGAPAGKVHVTFSDGRQDDYDIVVGADGIGSPTRKIMLGPSFPDPSYDLGYHMAFFTAPQREGDSADWTLCNLPGGKNIMTRKDSPDNIRVYLTSRGGSCRALDSAPTLAEQKRALVDIFRGSEGGKVERFMRDLDESPLTDDLYTSHMTQIRLPEGAWSRGRVALVGDAACCPTPFGGGIGTTVAIIGAYVLAGEIAREWEASGGSAGAFSMERASGEYERKVRPFVKERQDISPWVLKAFFPETKLGIWILQTILQVCTALRIDRLFFNLVSPEESRKLQYDDYFGMKAEK